MFDHVRLTNPIERLVFAIDWVGLNFGFSTDRVGVIYGALPVPWVLCLPRLLTIPSLGYDHLSPQRAHANNALTGAIAILDEYQNYLGVGGGLEGSEKSRGTVIRSLHHSRSRSALYQQRRRLIGH